MDYVGSMTKWGNHGDWMRWSSYCQDLLLNIFAQELSPEIAARPCEAQAPAGPNLPGLLHGVLPNMKVLVGSTNRFDRIYSMATSTTWAMRT